MGRSWVMGFSFMRRSVFDRLLGKHHTPVLVEDHPAAESGGQVDNVAQDGQTDEALVIAQIHDRVAFIDGHERNYDAHIFADAVHPKIGENELERGASLRNSNLVRLSAMEPSSILF